MRTGGGMWEITTTKKKHLKWLWSTNARSVHFKGMASPPKTISPKKTRNFFFGETFQRCLIEWRKKKITDCQRCSEATFSSLIVSFGRRKKMADNNTHEINNTKGLAPKTYGYVCAIRVKKEESQHEKLGTYYLIAGSRKQPGWHPILFVEKKNHVLRLMLTNSRNEWPTSFFSLCTEKISCESRIKENRRLNLRR